MRLNASANNRNFEIISFNQREKTEKLISEKYGAKAWKSLLSTAIAANYPSKQPPIFFDIIYTADINIYNNQEYIQIRLEDIRLNEQPRH
jgi:hypothetical protein